ncbi:MAG: bifunctional methylenetetrahydrofolate dehydrogenase/methenyltetrahydrofolate cyclohydrolase FolD [Gammaproteobacteria bacterium]|nr:bifunctional methylenetetrahydrofolate dehydrogenase/methenyltetrahydrofolate cyclohydrolase FolD [Gammaproteobacteria bacterium]MBU2675693.1 bifunctional methylenetetrahydrofolate dehydrogenase/methenyltetrahydrofolate cyclohydrolase FolD [Gammaproteobacteria bacterium]NNC56862.1 bifunctional methylenetetrahydrofolate dehydrogenase/methenyltetrahydrofolate cyclohydrolase FolD [Woeseiaceae bacterium]NNL49431.1 bifunctional methylenetetrahydrofolate dehydrogenase/methenyltetrahydrofolate cyclo
MTTAKRIDGKAKADQLAASITEQTAALLREHGLRPGLAVVIIGDDPASQVYVRNKKRRAEACGFFSVQHTLAEDTSQTDVLKLIDSLNNDEAIHGILVQLPLPEHLDEQTITQAVAPTKDVDGFHFVNIGKLTAGHTADAFVPCTPAGCMLMIEDELGPDLSGKNAVIIGRSNIVGKPMASLLLQRNATITITHSRTADLSAVVSNADIVVAAVGRANMVKADWIKPGAVVIDVGINRVETRIDGETRSRLTGDVDYDDVCSVAGAVTPVPGGVGPMTITMLMFNTLRSARLSAGLEG